MKLQHRVAWLTALAIIVGGGSALVGVSLYFSARAHAIPGGLYFGPPRPEPAFGTFLLEYWYGWLSIALAWLGVAYLARRMLRVSSLRQAPTWPEGYPSPMKMILGAELISIVVTIAGFTFWLHGYRSGWF